MKNFMKKKQIILGLLVSILILISVAAFATLFSSPDSEIKGISDIATPSQQDLWGATVDKYISEDTVYLGKGTIKTSVQGFSVELDFEFYDNGTSSEMKIFSNNHEAYVKFSDDQAYFSNESQDEWYQVIGNNESSESNNLNIFTGLASFSEAISNTTPLYEGSISCTGDICQQYSFEYDGKQYLVTIHESISDFNEVTIAIDGSEITVAFESTTYSFTEPDTVIALREDEYEDTIRSIISPIVRDSINLGSIFGL